MLVFYFGYIGEAQHMELTKFFGMQEIENLGWDKVTIAYAEENKNSIYRQIRNSLRTHGQKAAEEDVEDIYMLVLMNMYRKCDYSEELEPHLEEGEVGVAGYVGSIVKYSVFSWINSGGGENTVSFEDPIGENGMTVGDTISGEPMEENVELTDIREACQELNKVRYMYGVDAIRMLYVMSSTDNVQISGDIGRVVIGLTERGDVADGRYKDIISKYEEDSVVVEVIKWVCKDRIKAHEELSRYMFGLEEMDQLIIEAQEIIDND